MKWWRSAIATATVWCGMWLVGAAGICAVAWCGMWLLGMPVTRG